ncbi:MAG: right-handed parallel beta-helix repeat-containing protein, partial [Planctomycetes bacterium]|nr:right-handed parallel beta-helix repeat-containing protein [Planctomycetota bacterium]
QGSKWRVRGLTVSASFGEPYEGAMLKFADGGASSEIIVEDCFVYSTLDTSKWGAKEWMAANSGITMGRQGKGHVVRNCYVFNTRFGIALCAENSICEGNVVSHFSADGIRVTRDGQLVQHNVIRNIYVSDDDGDKNHDDAIQCFLFNVGTGTVRNVTIRENLVVMRESEDQKLKANMQGIGFFDGPLIGFTVEGNVINTSHWHGVSLFDAQDCTIRNNVCYTQWQAEKLRPWVMLGTKNKGEVKGNTVTGNYAYTFDLKNDKGVTARDNNPVTEEIHTKRQAELLALIEKKYGKTVPAAGFKRLGLERVKWIEGTASADGQRIEAIDAALNQGRPVVLYLYKATEKAAEKFERETLEDAAVNEQLDHATGIRINVDDLSRDLKKKYGLGSKPPAIIILKPDGTPVWDAAGPTAKQLAKQLQAARGEVDKGGG